MYSVLEYAKKRGQITVFIIIGIIMLFLTVIIFFIVNSAAQKRLEVEKEEMAEPFSAEPIRMFTEHCLETTANEDFTFISLQGGYYKVPEPAQDQIFIKTQV